LKRHPELENQRLKTLQLLEMNPPHPLLHLHALGERLQGRHTQFPSTAALLSDIRDVWGGPQQPL
jgi:hypothetical protein